MHGAPPLIQTLLTAMPPKKKASSSADPDREWLADWRFGKRISPQEAAKKWPKRKLGTEAPEGYDPEDKPVPQVRQAASF